MRRVRDVLRDRQFAYDEARNIVETVDFWRQELEKKELEKREGGWDPVRTPFIVWNGLVYESSILLILLLSVCVVGSRGKRGYAGTTRGA